MKKFLIPIVIFVIVVIGAIVFYFVNKDNNNDLKKITVGEVAHSIFYVPQYVTHALGYFEDEGLDVDIILTSGTDKVTASLLSGDIQIGFCGSEASI